MTLMLAGLLGIAAAAVLIYLVRRHEDVLRLQSHVLSARFALDAALRRRRELAEVWCTLCEERDMLAPHVRLVRRQLVQIAQAISEKKVSATQILSALAQPSVALEGSGETAPAAEDLPAEVLSTARIIEEKRLGRLIRDGYLHFLEGLTEDGPQAEFFRQYFESLTRLEREIEDAQDLYNDCARVYNDSLADWAGWIFRRWERLAPRPSLPSTDPSPRPRATLLPSSQEKPALKRLPRASMAVDSGAEAIRVAAPETPAEISVPVVKSKKKKSDPLREESPRA